MGRSVKVWLTDRVDLSHFEEVVHSQAKSWASADITYEFRPPGRSLQWPKPSASVRADAPQAVGELTVWVTGEAELEVGYRADAAIRSIHYDLTDETLAACLSDFVELLLTRPGEELLHFLNPRWYGNNPDGRQV
jgi:hypothetical protein